MTKDMMEEMKMWTKIKDTWNDLSKKAKIFFAVVAAIILMFSLITGSVN